MEYKNCFIGIDLPEIIRKEYIDLLIELKEMEKHLSIVNADFSHITLLFLESCNDKKIQKIIENTSPILSGLAGISLNIEGFGVFNPNKPRVVFLHVEPRKPLIVMNLQLSKLTNVAETRPYYPHLTVGRLNTFEAYTSFMKTHNIIGQRLNSVCWEFEISELGLYVSNEQFTQRKLHSFSF